MLIGKRIRRGNFRSRPEIVQLYDERKRTEIENKNQNLKGENPQEADFQQQNKTQKEKSETEKIHSLIFVFGYTQIRKPITGLCVFRYYTSLPS